MNALRQTYICWHKKANSPERGLLKYLFGYGTHVFLCSTDGKLAHDGATIAKHHFRDLFLPAEIIALVWLGEINDNVGTCSLPQLIVEVVERPREVRRKSHAQLHEEAIVICRQIRLINEARDVLIEGSYAHPFAFGPLCAHPYE